MASLEFTWGEVMKYVCPLQLGYFQHNTSEVLESPHPCSNTVGALPNLSVSGSHVGNLKLCFLLALIRSTHISSASTVS